MLTPGARLCAYVSFLAWYIVVSGVQCNAVNIDVEQAERPSMPFPDDDDEPKALVRSYSAQIAASYDPKDASNSTLRGIIAGDYDRARSNYGEDKNWERHFKKWSPVATK